MKMRIRALIVAVMVAASVVAFTSTANAGTYHVQQCHPNTGYQIQGGWGVATAGWGGGSVNGTCAGGIMGTTAFNPGSPCGVGNCSGADWLNLASPRIPGNLYYSQLTLNYFNEGGANAAVGPASLRQCTSTATVPCVGFIPTTPTTSGGNPGSVALPCTPGGAQPCKAVDFTGSYGYKVGHFWIGALDFSVVDPVAPASIAPYGGSLKSSANTAGRAWNRGTPDVYVSATDADSGVKSIDAYVDSVVADHVSVPTPVSCGNGPYANFQPCPGGYGQGSTVQTTAMSDGPHTLYGTAVDASGNAAASSVSFYADNTKPAVPADVEPDVSGTNGWNTSNSFTVNWTNTGETVETETESGIAQVVVDVNPTTGTQTDPAPVTVPVGSTASGIAATASSVSGVTVPAIGEWTLRLKVVDKAGNESEVGEGTGSDTGIGYDPAAPAKPGAFANGWIGRLELANGYDQEWNYVRGAEVAPICGFAGSIDSPSDPGTAINIPGDVRKWRLPASLTEATHQIHLRAVTCSGMASATIESVEAKVDLTDPTPSFDGVQDGRWYKDGQIVNLRGSDSLSGMAPSTDSDSTHGAYIKYSINGVGPQPEESPRGGAASIPVNGEGAKQLSFAPVDLAGNESKSTVVNFGIDASLPVGYFASQDAARPTVIKAPIGDNVSGVDYATIAVRKAGSGDDWTNLPTSVVDSGENAVGSGQKSASALTRFPDTKLPDGTYEARLRAFDLAGNELSTGKDVNGNSFLIRNPMRATTGLTASLSKATRICKKGKNGKMRCVVKKCTKKSKGLCFKKKKGRQVLVGGSTNLSVGYKRGALVIGTLTSATGSPLANQPVEIYTRAKIKDGGKDAKEVKIGETSTDSQGVYGYRVPSGVSRTVRVYYPGTEQREDVSATANLGTAAWVKATISKRHFYTGQTAKFSGKVTSSDGAMPASGKLIVLQFRAGKRWLPAVTVAHTDAKGKFSVKYKFAGRRVKNRIVFRVFAPSEDNWGHTGSMSKVFVIKLN